MIGQRTLALGAVLATVSACATATSVRRHHGGTDAGVLGPEDAGRDAAAFGRDATTPLDASTDSSGPFATDAASDGSRGPTDAASGPDGPLGELLDLPGTAMLRVAHFVDDGPPVHVCVRPAGADAGSKWIPVTGSAELGMFPGGLRPFQVTAYASVPSGTLDVRLVAATGGPACAQDVLVETALLAFDDHESRTVLFRGRSAAIEVRTLRDSGGSDPGSVRLRVVHAAVDQGPLEVRSQTFCQEVERSLTFDTAVGPYDAGPYSPCPPDAFGYHTIGLPGYTVAGDLTLFDGRIGTPLGSFALPDALDAFKPGHASTVFVRDDASAPNGIGLVVCSDLLPSLDALSTCMPAGASSSVDALVRFVNTLTDGPYDVCVKSSNAGWDPSHRVLTGLGYLGEGSAMLATPFPWTVAFVPEGADCSVSTPYSTVFSSPGPIGFQLTALSGLGYVPDASVNRSPGVWQIPEFLNGPPAPGTVDSVLGSMPSATLDYFFGPVSTFQTVDPLSFVGGTSTTNLSGSQPLGLYAATHPAGTQNWGMPVLRRRTNAPVTLASTGIYSVTFASRSGSEPTDLLVCELDLPAPGAAAPPCAAYALDVAP